MFLIFITNEAFLLHICTLHGADGVLRVELQQALGVFGSLGLSVGTALGITGLVVAMPVFFDAGLIILIPLAFSLAKRTKRSVLYYVCLLYTSPSPRDATLSRMPSSA